MWRETHLEQWMAAGLAGCLRQHVGSAGPLPDDDNQKLVLAHHTTTITIIPTKKSYDYIMMMRTAEQWKGLCVGKQQMCLLLQLARKVRAGIIKMMRNRAQALLLPPCLAQPFGQPPW